MWWQTGGFTQANDIVIQNGHMKLTGIKMWGKYSGKKTTTTTSYLKKQVVLYVMCLCGQMICNKSALTLQT